MVNWLCIGDFFIEHFLMNICDGTFILTHSVLQWNFFFRHRTRNDDGEWCGREDIHLMVLILRCSIFENRFSEIIFCTNFMLWRLFQKVNFSHIFTSKNNHVRFLFANFWNLVSNSLDYSKKKHRKKCVTNSKIEISFLIFSKNLQTFRLNRHHCILRAKTRLGAHSTAATQTNIKDN